MRPSVPVRHRWCHHLLQSTYPHLVRYVRVTLPSSGCQQVQSEELFRPHPSICSIHKAHMHTRPAEAPRLIIITAQVIGELASRRPAEQGHESARAPQPSYTPATRRKPSSPDDQVQDREGSAGRETVERKERCGDPCVLFQYAAARDATRAVCDCGTRRTWLLAPRRVLQMIPVCVRLGEDRDVRHLARGLHGMVTRDRAAELTWMSAWHGGSTRQDWYIVVPKFCKLWVCSTSGFCLFFLFYFQNDNLDMCYGIEASRYL